MRIHYLQHVPFEGPGSIEKWAVGKGYSLTRTRLYAGDPLPALEKFDWLIIMGGPMSIHDETDYPWLKVEKDFIRLCIDSGKTVLGVCLGAQLIADTFGARVYPGPQKEIGWYPITLSEDVAQHPLGQQLGEKLLAFHWHGETFDLPEGALRLASSAVCQNQGFIYNDRVIGLQFHLETTWASAQELILHSQEELAQKGPTIQTEFEMLAETQRFDDLYSAMNTVLEYLENL